MSEGRSLRLSLREIVEGSESAAAKIFDGAVLFLIAVSIVGFSLGTLPDLRGDVAEALDLMEVAIVVIFSLEYLLRLYVAERRRDYLFSFYGMIDLIAILPFYIAGGADVLGLRALRLLRLLDAFHIFRRSRARFARALFEVREEMALLLFVVAVLLYAASVGIYYFEHEAQPERFGSVFHSFWWTIITLTTIGYGDVYPITLGGKMFASLVALVGVGTVAAPAGLLAATLSHSVMRGGEDEKDKKDGDSESEEREKEGEL